MLLNVCTANACREHNVHAKTYDAHNAHATACDGHKAHATAYGAHHSHASASKRMTDIDIYKSKIYIQRKRDIYSFFNPEQILGTDGRMNAGELLLVGSV